MCFSLVGKLTKIIVMAFVVVGGARMVGAQEDIALNNTFQYTRGGVYKWQVYVEADQGVLKKIKSVEYRLHPSYRNPVRKVEMPRSGKYPFKIVDETQEAFDITATIVFWNDPPKTVYHRLKLRPDEETPVTEEILLTQRSQFTLSQQEFQGKLAVSVGNISFAGLELKIFRTSGGEVKTASSGSKVSLEFRFNGKNYVLKGRTRIIVFKPDSLYFTIYRKDPG
jgi:transcription initiation factor IIF auxiliary subunit